MEPTVNLYQTILQNIRKDKYLYVNLLEDPSLPLHLRYLIL